MDNKISIQISDKDLKAAKDAIKVLTTTLNPLLITLTNTERITTPKMGDGTEPFVEKSLEYFKSNPEFALPYLDVVEMEKDFKASKELRNLLNPLEQLIQRLDDSILQAGSEAYVTSLAYYTGVKNAARMNIPGAKVVHEELRNRFRRKSTLKGTTEPKADS